ncbi:hypothetical protein LguiB_013058 [Lonicera macranthoides]
MLRNQSLTKQYNKRVLPLYSCSMNLNNNPSLGRKDLRQAYGQSWSWGRASRAIAQGPKIKRGTNIFFS